jgi:hypothetical protein
VETIYCPEAIYGPEALLTTAFHDSFRPKAGPETVYCPEAIYGPGALFAVG